MPAPKDSRSSRGNEAQTDSPKSQSLLTSAATFKTRYGLDNPHPLSQLKTELVWDGKYDEYGNRRAVDIAGCAMPLQKIETIDEPRSRAAADGQIEMFEQKLLAAGRARHSVRAEGGQGGDGAQRTDAPYQNFRNRLIWGDNKLVMASLLAEFKGKIDLFYIDPPFDVGADFTMDVPIGDEKETIEKDQSTLEMVAYRDMWGKGTDSYLHMMFERLSLMKELLSEKGSICVHCDWRVNGYLRSIMDEVFGRGAAADGGSGLRNQVAWCYSGGGIPQNEMPRKYDTILWYSKSADWTFHPVYRPYSPGTIERGRTAVKGPDAELRSEGTPVNDWWPDVKKITSPTDPEKLGYDTQKSEELLTRIITMLSSDGDLVGDIFCGSGTTGAVAERLGRRWIMADLGRFAIHTSRKRLIELQRKLHDEGNPYRAFDVYNLGRYERQWWQKERLKGADEEHRKVVLGFYKAEVLPNPGAYLHGRKGRAFVFVDGIDSILTRDEVRAVAKAAREAGAKEVHCLAWEFEMDLRLVCHELEASEGVLIKLIPIPREIMEKNRTSPPPFLEVAVLEAEVVYRSVGRVPSPGAGSKTPGRGTGPTTAVDIKLTKFLPSLAEVPSKELEALKERAVKSGFDFIDFWAVDFNWHDGKPFEHHWQDYRTRKDRSLKTVSDAGFGKYPKPGKYTACVKVVDVFGCDTSITVDVSV
ncbi:MAG: site-specific DNA-methyltransferase [Verrucomicrobia bacterium]|jgi:DNA modification methylase|nr:site-specific DNA-methyltransferase [Verrucomicrobiota bacterium]